MKPVQQNPEPPKEIPKKDFSKLLPVVISIVALIIIAAISFFFMQKNGALTSSLEGKTKEIEGLNTKNNELEKELIYLKNTDLAKELEIVNLKLQESDEELKEIKTNLASREKTLKDLQTSTSSIPKITNILSLMFDLVAGNPGQCFSGSYKSKVDQALNSYGDQNWTSIWNNFIANTDSANCSWSPPDFQKSLNYGLGKIEAAVK